MHFLVGKPLAECSVSVLSQEVHKYQILIEVSYVSKDEQMSKVS